MDTLNTICTCQVCIITCLHAYQIILDACPIGRPEMSIKIRRVTQSTKSNLVHCANLDWESLFGASTMIHVHSLRISAAKAHAPCDSAANHLGFLDARCIFFQRHLTRVGSSQFVQHSKEQDIYIYIIYRVHREIYM